MSRKNEMGQAQSMQTSGHGTEQRQTLGVMSLRARENVSLREVPGRFVPTVRGKGGTAMRRFFPTWESVFPEVLVASYIG